VLNPGPGKNVSGNSPVFPRRPGILSGREYQGVYDTA